MRIEILSEAAEDLLNGYHFYERQAPNLGNYFLDSLYSDIDSLLVYAGIHPIVYGKHRSLSKRFPYAIYYSVEVETVRVHAVLDCRRNPSWIRKRLRKT
jgi:plasmid stabilization system protein ParE